MSIEHLIAFNITLLAAIASPGPALLVAIRTSISEGKIAGIVTGCGLGFMAAIWTLLALLGLDGLFRLFPWFYIAAKVLGALYLMYIAWQTWRGARAPVKEADKSGVHSFANGILINLSNPKSVLFAAAVLVVIFPADLSLLEKGFIALNHLAFEIIFYSILASIMSKNAIQRSYLKAKVYLDRFAALVMGVLAARILILGERR